MIRQSLSSFLPVALMILSTALASAQQGSPANPPTTTQSTTLSSTSPIVPATPAPVSTNPTVSSTIAPAIVPSGMQAPAQQTSGTERSSYSSIRVDGPYIAMTFDDGPDAKLTPRLLDILKERHIHATFFVLGNMVQSHPEILQREAIEGHEIGNHSWSHLPLTKVVQREGGLHHELADTSDLIKQTIGKPVTLMRPPYGATNPRLSKAIEREYGMKVILWSVDPDDWKDPGPSVVSSRILDGWKQSGGAKPGAIILSHDIHKGTIEAMPATLDALLAKGYKFVTISELMALEGKNPTPVASPSGSPSAQKSSKSKKHQS